MLGIFLRTVTFVPVPVGVPLNARPVVQFSAPSRCSSRMLDDADRESRRRDDAARRSEYSADLGGTDLDMSALRERSIATLSPPPSHPRPLTPALSPPLSGERIDLVETKETQLSEIKAKLLILESGLGLSGMFVADDEILAPAWVFVAVLFAAQLWVLKLLVVDPAVVSISQAL